MLPYKLVRTLLSFSLLLMSTTTLAAESAGTVLVTGANRGIGLALAERFQRGGYTVIGTARSPDKATELAALGVRVEALEVPELDFTDPESAAALV